MEDKTNIEKIIADWKVDGSETLNDLVTKAYQAGIKDGREEVDRKIGMVRQWLNEDRITDVNKMVTNEDLKVFLSSKE